MKIKLLCILILNLIISQHIGAQNNAQAEKIISNIISNVKAKPIKTNFKLVISDKNNSQGQSTNGTFTLFGNKFTLEITDMKVYFDGKTQWAYIPQNNEVSITEPTEKELSETNPMAILSSFKSKSLIRFSTKSKSNLNYFIEMTPKAKQQGIEKIELIVVKSSEIIQSIKIINSNGSISTLTLTNFQKTVVNNNNFTFNQSKYKGIVINDLR